MALGYQNSLIVAQSDGTALTNSVTGASILPAAAKWTMPANFLDFIGKSISLRAWGRVSTVATTPGTLTFEFRLGPTSTIIAATSPAFALNVNAKTNVPWVLEWGFTARSLGASTSATLMHIGGWRSEAVIGAPLPAAGGVGELLIPAAAPAVGTGFDSTVANVTDLQAKWSIASASNSIQTHGYYLVSLN